MSQKDYIKRGNPKAKKPAAKGAKRASKTQAMQQSAPPTATPMPYLAIGVACLVLGGFGYFLWSINGAANDAPAPSVSAPPPTKVEKRVAAQHSEPEIPPPPEKEQWEYMSELKQKEVAVEVKELEKKGPFVMQCATFKENQRAEAFRAQLALLGFESRIKISKTSGGRYNHRVQLGPYETNRDAQKARHKLARHKINGCKIWKWS